MSCDQTLSPTQARVENLTVRALELRGLDLSYAKIGEELGISGSRAAELCNPETLARNNERRRRYQSDHRDENIARCKARRLRAKEEAVGV